MEIIKKRPSTDGGSFIVFLLTSPSFLAGPQGHQVPHTALSPSWILQALFGSVALEGTPSLKVFITPLHLINRLYIAGLGICPGLNPA